MRCLAFISTALLLACGGGKPAAAPPATPANVVAHAGDGQVTVLWDASAGALGYRVYSGAAALATHVDVGSATSWTVVGLSNGTAYQFAVSALGSGGESALSAAVRATPLANVPLEVAGVTPADGATAVPRNAAVVVKFNRPATNVSAGCLGTVLLSDDSFATCAAGSFAASDGGATWTFTPTAPLHAGATYKLRVTTGVKDANALALASQFDSAGFTTNVALAAAIAPSGTVALRPQITVTFNRAVTAASVTSIASGTACGGTVQLSAGGACVALTQALSGNVATFTPAADLAPQTAYAVTVTTGVLDSDGLPLAAAATGGFTTVAGVSVTGVDFQHIALVWALPDSATESRVSVRPSGGSYSSYTSFAAPTAGATLLLTPGKTWDVKVTTVSAGVESGGSEVLGVATGFSGTAAEWLDGQTAAGEAGGHFRFTWSESAFFAAYSDATDTATLDPANGDALWIAFDTDPDSDAAGEARTTTGLNGEIIWPFKADYVVELKAAGANLRTVSSNSWAPLPATRKLTPQIAEIGFDKSALGSFTKVRIALLAVATHAGDAQPAYSFDLAPAHGTPLRIPTRGQLASLTDSFPSTLDPSAFATSVPASVAATGLLHFTLNGLTTSNDVTIKGNISPLSYGGLSLYRLPQSGPTYEGYFNFGGQTGELFFKFLDGAAPEPIFPDGKDRVFTIESTTVSVPELTWNARANYSFTLKFIVPSAGSPASVVGNDTLLGAWDTTRGAAFTGPVSCPPPDAANTCSAVDVLFSRSSDFVTSALAFKAWYGSSYEGGGDHHMDDDVINKRILYWTPGLDKNF